MSSLKKLKDFEMEFLELDKQRKNYIAKINENTLKSKALWDEYKKLEIKNLVEKLKNKHSTSEF